MFLYFFNSVLRTPSRPRPFPLRTRIQMYLNVESQSKLLQTSVISSQSSIDNPCYMSGLLHPALNRGQFLGGKPNCLIARLERDFFSIFCKIFRKHFNCFIQFLFFLLTRIYARARELRVLWWIRIYECPRGCHSVQPYPVYTPSARFIFFRFFGFVLYHIIETLSLTTDRALALLWGSAPDLVGGSPLKPPERPPAYEYGTREMVLPASTVPREVEIHRR